MFSKETNLLTTTKTNQVLKEVSQLVLTSLRLNESQITVKHDLILSMIDGKVCNALTDPSSQQKCYICGATLKMMNGELKDLVVKKEHYGFGLSTLHAWNPFF